MGEVHPGIPAELALALAKRYNLKTLVETGTYHGDSAEWARGFFNLVYTIEIDHGYWIEARKRLKKFENVFALHGDSPHVLNMVLALLRTPTLFFLDAHYSIDLHYPRKALERTCPVLDEIAEINKVANVHVILVDDARTFGKDNGFPSLPSVYFALENNGQREVVEIEDVLVATPRNGFGENRNA